MHGILPSAQRRKHLSDLVTSDVSAANFTSANAQQLALTQVNVAKSYILIYLFLGGGGTVWQVW